MKKILALLMALCMVLPFAVMAEEATPVKTGLSFVTELTDSKDGQVQINLYLTAVTVDDNGVIDACEIDCVQAKIKFDATGKLTTPTTTEFQSKMELDDAYNMRRVSSISAEWDEQTRAFAAYCVGKTAEQLAAMPLDEAGKPVDIISSCTMPVDQFLPGVLDAVAKATHLGAQKGDALKLTQTSNAGSSKDATAEADGQGHVTAHVGAFTMNGDVITSAYIDAVQAAVTFNAEGKITADLTAPVLTKNEKKEAYNMKGASPIGKEWYEQVASFCQFITGKTLADAVATAANPAATDVITSCTIKLGDFVKILVKAAQ